MDKHRYALELVRRRRARIDGVVLMTDDLVSRLRARDAEWQAMCDRWQQQADALGHGHIMRESDPIIRPTIYVEAAETIDALERLRPHWAMGFTSDSIAAQTTITALNQIWSMLGVDNQTAAMDRLRQLTGAERT
jgi:hypothetical protein